MALPLNAANDNITHMYININTKQTRIGPSLAAIKLTTEVNQCDCNRKQPPKLLEQILLMTPALQAPQ